MKYEVKNATVFFLMPQSLYSLDALRIAGEVVSRKAECQIKKSKHDYSVSLKHLRPMETGEALERLALEFMNEALNQEYRFLVGRFNGRISSLISTQCLLAARGGENPPPPIQESEKFRSEVDAMFREAQDEINRTMPKKIPPRGAPLA